MTRPVNPNITIPAAFAVDGQKTDFTNEKLQNGFDPVDPDVLAGDNLNKFIDDTYKGLNYSIDGVTDLYDVTDNLKDLSNLSATGQAVLDGKANTNLSNLTTTGDAHFANPSLSNLNTTGNNRLHALKSYEDNGELLTDSEGLADVTSYAHSTFDSTKFTVIGSPTITSDGIASGFTTSDYLSIPATINNETNIVIKGNFTYGSLTGRQWLFICYNASASNESIQLVPYDNGGLSVRVCNGANQFGSMSWNETEVPRTVGATYNFEIRINGTNASATINGVTKSRNDFYPFTSTSFRLGASINNFPFLGSTNLKQFSITINGEKVFSGNKTGIDTIKPDDYTVVGTPTITDDGVLTNYSTSSYLSKTGLSITDDIIKVRIPFIIKESIPSGSNTNIIQTSSGTSPNTGNTHIDVRNVNGSIWVASYIHDGTNGGYSSPRTAGKNLQLNTWYVAESIYYISEHKNTVNVYKDGLLWDTTTTTLPNALSNWTAITTVQIGATTGYGDIDLNGIEILGNNSLIYQPCLKIVYTESKTGSKVVDSYYRPRVEDMYNQFGYAPYYTLSDSDFTLPQGEIYGMMLNQSTPHIVESYENGKSGYIVYSNGLCKQWGYLATNSTSKLEYTATLFKTFKDTNYNFYRSTDWTAAASSYNDNFSSFYDVGYTDKTTTTVSFWMHENTYQNGTDWVAFGYIN